MKLPLLSLSLLAMFAAPPAHAEKMKEAHLKALAPQIRATCMQPSEKNSWMTPQQLGGVCSCTAGKMAASMRKANFENTRAPTAADKKQYAKFQDAAAVACMQPVFKVQTAKKVRQECVAKASTVPVMKGLSKPRLDKMCGCVSERYARTWTMALVSKYPDAGAAMEGSRGLFAESIAACAKK